MRFHELGLERTSISYFTGPPGLVDNTAKSITWEDKKKQWNNQPPYFIPKLTDR